MKEKTNVYNLPENDKAYGFCTASRRQTTADPADWKHLSWENQNCWLLRDFNVTYKSR